MLLPFYPPSSSFRRLGVISLRNSWDRDPRKAQRNLEVIINTIRQGTTIREAYALYHQLLSEADGEAKELPYDMLLYLGEHHERYMIKL